MKSERKKWRFPQRAPWNRYRKIPRRIGGCRLVLAVLLVLAVSGCGKEKELELLEIPGEAGENPALESRETEAGPKEEEPQKTPAPVWVDVCGAVNRPGVYQLEEGSRLCEAIAAAGGLREDARSDSVNQAREVADGEQIRVYTREEYEQQAPPPGQETAQSGGKVNINTASEEELQELNGIGPAKAAAIAAYRKEHGEFQSPEELRQVEGIGEGTYNKLKDDIVVS